uniref:FA complementation group A n=1 Tax=Sphenodon punctatus TaxID=8508 RepID=A0A8D0GNN4_SPHPU
MLGTPLSLLALGVLVSALQEQASRLGVPLGILSARTAATNIEKISLVSAESRQAVLLNVEKRKKLSCLLETVKDLLACNAFCRLLFCQEMWKMQVRTLENHSLKRLLLCLRSHSDTPTVVAWLCDSLCLLCKQMDGSSQDAELLGLILSGKPLAFETLELSAWEMIPAPKLSDFHRDVASALPWLNIFSVTTNKSKVAQDSLQQFFIHTLTQILTYSPLLKVSDAINLQREWSFARSSLLLTTLYRRLFVVFSAEKLIRHLQQVLETHEVNWHHVLSCVSTLVVCQADAEHLVKDLLGHLLLKAFENYDLENMITAFLLARQAALEGPAIFMSYAEWFKVSFGNASGYHGSSKKASVFLFKFLSDLVPFEVPRYLKVHIMHPPFVPTKYRPFLLEYISLAKTRLADFKVAIEDIGLYEDLSAAKETLQPQCQALQDVEKAIQIFENTGKIPTSVMEASIFRRSYYTSRFIPALLTPRVLPETPDLCMAFIDALKSEWEFPPLCLLSIKSTPSTFLKAGALAPFTPSHSFLPVFPAAVPAQIAEISEKLTAVLGRSSDKEEAESFNLQIHVNISDPKLDPRDQEVVDLLLTTFCQNLIAASYFNPPERQGLWPSLYVKMMCGHRHLLPSLLTRLCQLLYYQGPSLSEAHVLGLAALVIHLNESKSLIPEVNICSQSPESASARGLPITEYWNHLLRCRTGESLAFCMRFCTAVSAYFFCKFPSRSHDGFCTLLHPSFIKKLQYAVPRLILEARGTGCEEEAAELLWKSLSQPALSYERAALCLWKQTSFQELLQERTLQLTFQEWLLLELGLHPDEDTLSPSERQDFHYWALYQWYLPASPAAGGCDGDLAKACAILIHAILDFSQRYCIPPGYSCMKVRSNPDIHCRLQEMVLELELDQKRTLPRSSRDKEEHFLFGAFQSRLRTLGTDSALAEQLRRQQELLLQSRILLSLPPSVLITACRGGRKTTLDCEDFFHFVNTELRHICSRGYALSYEITACFFRGLLSASLDCDEPVREVNAVLAACRTKCPIIICSALWWQRLEPALCSQWKRLFGAPLAHELKRLKECQRSATSFFSSEAAGSLPDPPWISAAFLHLPLRQATRGRMRETLKRLASDVEEVRQSVLILIFLQLLSASIPKALDLCLEMLGCLEERGISWLVLFNSLEKGLGPYQILHSTASDQYRRLLPVAFYSLIPCFHSDQLTREQTFLSVAVDMYTRLLRLYMEGETAMDPLEIITKARQFLLQTIPRCPQKSFLSVQQLLEPCGELDPEIKALLLNSWKPIADENLHDEPFLF